MEVKLFILLILTSQIIPLDDPLVEMIERLETKGILQGLPDTRPYTWTDLEVAIPDEEVDLSKADIFDLERVLQPAPDYSLAPALKLKGEDASFFLGGALRTNYRIPDTLRAGPEVRYFGTLGPVSFFATHRLTYASGWPDTVFDAKSWRGDERPVFAEIPDARVDADFGWVQLQAGRSQMQLGPVPDGGLMLSTQPWGTDHAAATFKWKGVRFTSMYAWIQPEKQMVMQRFEYIAPRWKMGLTEVVVSGDSNDIFPYIAAPVAFFYFMQWNKEQDENILWSADAEVFFPPARIYAEFLVDDFAYEPATGPHKIGGTIGGEWVDILGSEIDLRTDYTAITKWTYSQRHDEQNYTMRGRLLGDDLGPDADRLRMVLGWRIIPRMHIEISGFLERHGEGDVTRDFRDDGADTPEEYHPPFPSGVVERHLGAEIETRFTVIGRNYLVLSGRFEDIANIGHVEGDDQAHFSLDSGIYWEF